MSRRTETARRDARTAGKTAKSNYMRCWREITRKRGRNLNADDCMEFYRASSAYRRHIIRTEAIAAGFSILQYLRQEIPALVEEGRRAAVAA